MRVAIVTGNIVSNIIIADSVAVAGSLFPGSVAVDVEALDVEIGFVMQPDGSFAPPLPDLKDRLKAKVDTDAETARLKYITGGSGQAMTYTQKADEAARYLASSSPVASDYPLLTAEIGITASTLAGVAQIVQAAYAQWRIVGAAIEAARLGAKAAISNATTDADARAAANVNWP